MTPGELKFALLLESHLNSLPNPEYRQLVVECLMVVSLVTTASTQLAFGGTLVVEHIIDHAHHLFLQDQVSRCGLRRPRPSHHPCLYNCSGGTWGLQWTAVVVMSAAVEVRPASVCISTTVPPVVAMAP